MIAWTGKPEEKPLVLERERERAQISQTQTCQSVVDGAAPLQTGKNFEKIVRK